MRRIEHKILKLFLCIGVFTGINLTVKAYNTPTMGWSSWNTYRVNINDKLIRTQADAMLAKGLKEAGYTYINIDDGYFGGRDATGRLKTHPLRFPNGLKGTVDYIHQLGFKAGIYSDAGRNTCGSYWDKDSMGIGVGLYGHDQQDANYFFKELGFDFIKVDFCGGDAKQNFEHLGLNEQQRYTDIHNAILKTGRTDVRLNVCRWTFPGTWVRKVADSWRISPDIAPNWNSVKSIINRNKYLSAFATEGKFNDMDMLEIGRGLSAAEERTHFGMWCMLSSPLLIGCNMTTIPEASLNLIKNPELIALNQDPLALQAHIRKVENGVYLFVKDILIRHSTTRAIALYNPTDQKQTFTLKMDYIDLGGSVKIRDLINRRDLPEVINGSLTVTIDPHDTQIYKLTAQKRGERRVYEAESGWLEAFQTLTNNETAGTAIFDDDPSCSAGGKVSWLGHSKDNYLEWRNVYSKHGGTYKMTISYLKGKGRHLFYSINGGASTRLLLLTPKTINEHVVTIRLQPGNNIIRLFNDTDWTPDIDKITLAKLYK